MENSIKTPAIIVKNNISFSIPIYQRLYAWTPGEIYTLMDDLYSHFKECKKVGSYTHYYIGLLTSTVNQELVDGQQRFTAIMLIALVLRNYPKGNDNPWNNFLIYNNHPRLTFSAREEDQTFFINKIENKEGTEDNTYMEASIKAITTYMVDLKDDKKQSEFSSFIFNYLAFFVQELPKGYSGRMLNKYFEAMNSTGRNLENHEILKVDLLKDTESSEYDNLTNMWNKASRMNQTVLPFYNEEKRNDYQKAIRDIKEKNFHFSETISDEHPLSILDSINTYKNSNRNIENSSKHRSFLTFTDFLLQILYLKVVTHGGEILNLHDFFKPDNLRKTFKTYKEKGFLNNPAEFIKDLYKYRIIFDWVIIRTDGEGDYVLGMKKEDKSFLQQYEAMLYVSSSRDTYYQWVPFILDYVEKNGADNENGILEALKQKDNRLKNHQLEKEKLYYGGFDNYIFRRLDYYIWEVVSDGNDYGFSVLFPDGYDFKDKEEFRNAVLSYKFHQYNSVEHFHPQNEDKQRNKWFNKDIIDDFGNLALISSNFNSEQNNNPMIEKFDHVKYQIKNKCVQSLKLLVMYYSAEQDSEKWTDELMKKHREKMVDFLSGTYEVPQNVKNKIENSYGNQIN